MVRTPRLTLIAAAGCFGAFAALLLLAYFVPLARFVDDAALYGFTRLDRAPIQGPANLISHVCDPLPFALLAIAAIVAAALTRGLRYGVAAGVLLVGANATSQLLKPLLAYTRPGTDVHGLHHMHAASYPSGHATASMTLVLAAVMLTPRPQRPLVAIVGGVFSLLLSFSVVLLSWHYPSDVVGGYLVATTWTLVVLAALRYAAARWPEAGTMRLAAREAIGPVPSLRTLGLVVAAVAVIAALVAATRAGRIADFAQRYTAAVAVGMAIALCAGVLIAGVTALSRRRR